MGETLNDKHTVVITSKDGVIAVSKAPSTAKIQIVDADLGTISYYLGKMLMHEEDIGYGNNKRKR